jgi:hypothetical protein
MAIIQDTHILKCVGVLFLIIQDTHILKCVGVLFFGSHNMQRFDERVTQNFAGKPPGRGNNSGHPHFKMCGCPIFSVMLLDKLPH